MFVEERKEWIKTLPFGEEIYPSIHPAFTEHVRSSVRPWQHREELTSPVLKETRERDQLVKRSHAYPGEVLQSQYDLSTGRGKEVLLTPAGGSGRASQRRQHLTWDLKEE